MGNIDILDILPFNFPDPMLMDWNNQKHKGQFLPSGNSVSQRVLHTAVFISGCMAKHRTVQCAVGTQIRQLPLTFAVKYLKKKDTEKIIVLLFNDMVNKKIHQFERIMKISSYIRNVYIRYGILKSCALLMCAYIININHLLHTNLKIKIYLIFMTNLWDRFILVLQMMNVQILGCTILLFVFFIKL